jgi:hypothetical protein
VLNGGCAKVFSQFLEHGFTGDSVVSQNPDFDQTVCFKGGIGFFDHGGGEAVVADHDNGIEVVRFGSVNLALSGSQLNLRHGAIIPA